MNNIKKITVIFLLILSVLLFPACNDKSGTNTAGDDAPGASDTAGEANAESQSRFDALPAVDYGGADFIIGNINQDGYNWIDLTLDVDAESSVEMLSDAIYRRNRTVEEKYNIILKFVEVPHDQMVSKVKNQMLAGYCEYDLMQMPMKYTIMPLTVENYVADANKLESLDLTNPWWDDFAHSCTSIAGKQFFLFGDFTIADKEYATVIFLNKEMQKIYSLPDFYQIVKNGGWTCDKMLESMRAVTQDLNGNGKWDKEDQFGLVVNVHSSQQMFYGSGETIIKKDSADMPYWSVSNESYLNAFTKMWGFLHTDNTTFDAMSNGSHQDEMFADGKALFDATLLAAVRAPKSSEAMRDMEYDFGLLPPPKLDDKQENYYSYLDYSTPCMAILNNDAERLERASVVLEALNAKSSEEVQFKYMEYALPLKYFRDVESFEMLDIVLQNRIFDLGGIYGWGGFEDKMRNLLSSKNADTVASFIESNLGKSEEAMNRDIEKLLSLE